MPLHAPFSVSYASDSPAQSPSGSNPDLDVLIVGGGMVGLTLAAALGNTGLQVAVVERRPLQLQQSGVVEQGADGRASALALGTVQMFRGLGLWPAMQAMGVSPIHQIRVSDSDFPHAAHLRRQDIGAEALGYIVPNYVTQSATIAFLQTCDNVSLRFSTQVMEVASARDGVNVALAAMTSASGDPDSTPLEWRRAKVLIAADGSRSPLRRRANIPVNCWGYDQACIVTTVETEHPHQQTAYERFQPIGPFAILPMHDIGGRSESHRSCVVWTVPESDRDRLMSLPDCDFIAELSPWFGEQLGQVLSATPRACYSPQRSLSSWFVQSRFALIGDAAHSTHPVGGQGVNLGMRDVAVLAQVLVDADANGEDIGSLGVLRRYERWRKGNNWAVLLVTDLANRLFSNRIWPLQWLRRLGLIGLRFVPPFKRWLMLQAMGLGGRRARLIDGHALVTPSSQSRALSSMGVE
ncbi:MAG: UbiH/UbiF/VisC/COQ6 family ubiquinone biosynthesis hydroxylase [Cyanobacteria bacterium P01_G01_bin.4]